MLEGKGLNLLLDTANYQYKEVQLLDFKSLGIGVVQLHYAVDTPSRTKRLEKLNTIQQPHYLQGVPHVMLVFVL